ncbi:Carboxypeptidase Y-like protein [Apiospora saccharicola]
MISSGSIGMYDHMCKFDRDGKNKLKLGFNEATCRAVEEAVPRCARFGRQCVATYNLDLCRAAVTFCDEHTGAYLDVRVGGRVPYDDRVLCENGTLPLCGADSYADYLNQPRLQTALGLEGWNFTAVNMDLNLRWEANGDIYTPSTREMSHILDETDTRVLVINGNNDISVTTEGDKRVYDELAWSHQASFRLEKYVDWEWPDKSGKTNKGA